MPNERNMDVKLLITILGTFYSIVKRHSEGCLLADKDIYLKDSLREVEEVLRDYART